MPKSHGRDGTGIFRTLPPEIGSRSRTSCLINYIIKRLIDPLVLTKQRAPWTEGPVARNPNFFELMKYIRLKGSHHNATFD